MTGADGPRVLDISTGIPGAYAARLLGWAGADVVRAEPPGGDPMRRRDDGGPFDGSNAALYEYLRQGQRAVRLRPGDADGVDASLEPDGVDLVATGTELVIASPHGRGGDALRAAVREAPGLIVVAITPWGLDGPYRDRPATDFTLQADSGALAIRGQPDRPPYQLGGRTSLWMAGAYAAAAAMAFWRGRVHGGPGALVDLSIAEVANTGSRATSWTSSTLQVGSDGEPKGPPRVLETPSIERTADGWVGFNTNAPHQIDAFLRMMDRPDLADSGEFRMPADRIIRGEEWLALVTAWTDTRPGRRLRIVELAVAHRVPVAPVCNGRTVADLDQVVARGMLVDHPKRRRSACRAAPTGGSTATSVCRPAPPPGHRPTARVGSSGRPGPETRRGCRLRLQGRGPSDSHGGPPRSPCAACSSSTSPRGGRGRCRRGSWPRSVRM